MDIVEEHAHLVVKILVLVHVKVVEAVAAHVPIVAQRHVMEVAVAGTTCSGECYC